MKKVQLGCFEEEQEVRRQLVLEEISNRSYKETGRFKEEIISQIHRHAPLFMIIVISQCLQN